jgi:hypothetical protein
MRRGVTSSGIGGFGVGICAGVLSYGVVLAQEHPDLAGAVRYDARLEAAPTSSVRSQAGDAKASPLEVRLTGRIAFSPATVRSLVQVTPHANNRTLRVEIDSPDYARSSEVELDGERAARSHFFSWAALPPGEYSVVVSVLGPGGDVRLRRQAPFEVLGDAPDFRPEPRRASGGPPGAAR